MNELKTFEIELNYLMTFKTTVNAKTIDDAEVMAQRLWDELEPHEFDESDHDTRVHEVAAQPPQLALDDSEYCW
jgi:hypothetical protein